MLVNDAGHSTNNPGDTLDAYVSWRRLAVELRKSVIQTVPEGAFAWLDDWSDASGVTNFVKERTQADPDMPGLAFPRLPEGEGPHGVDAGVLLAMGGAKVFTMKIPALVTYVERGDALVPEGKGTRAVKLARTRRPGDAEDKAGSGVGFFKAIGVAVVGGVFTYAVVEAIKAVRGRD